MIKRVVVLGLRCSGTNYVEEFLSNNLKGVNVAEQIGSTFKHMWQGEVKFTIEQLSSETHLDDVLFIFLARNPYDQLQSFKLKPHHCLWAKALSMEEFLSRSPFVSSTTNSAILEKYQNVLSERNLKHRNVIEKITPNLPHYKLVSYEIVRDTPADWLNSLCEEFSLSLKHPSPRQVTYYKKTKSEPYRAKKYPGLSRSAKLQINNGIDWSIEAHWGYTPIELPALQNVNRKPTYSFTGSQIPASVVVRKINRT